MADNPWPMLSSLLVFLGAAFLLLQADGTDAVRVLNRRRGGGIDLCALTDHPALCRMTVRGRMDARRATETTINALIVQTRSALAQAARTKSAEGQLGQMMDACIDNFDDAVDNLVASLSNLRSGDKPSLSVNLSAALTDFENCKDSFAQFLDVKFPLDEATQSLVEMVNNSLALVSTLSEPRRSGNARAVAI